MAVSGVTCSPSRYCLNAAVQGLRSHLKQVHPLSSWGHAKEKLRMLHVERTLLAGFGQTCHLRKKLSVCAMDASFGDMANEYTGSNVFPRINVRDPYKRLGINPEASEEGIQGSNPFRQSHDKNNSAFLALGALTVLFSTEEGPTLQVAISLLATIYFIHSRLRNKRRAFLYGVGTFIFAWLLGTFLMVSVIPPLYKGARSVEVMTSVISYALLWVSSTYLK